MAEIIADSYSEIYNTYFAKISGSVNPAYYTAGGQAFTGNGGTLKKCKFYLSKAGLPTGSCYAKVYLETHEEDFGVDSLPTGEPIEISDAVDVETIEATNALIIFNFSQTNKITDGVKYVIHFVYEGGDNTKYIKLGGDIVDILHNGNASITKSGVCSPDEGTDFIFYVYTEEPAPPAGGESLPADTQKPTGYNCFISQFVKNMLAGFIPLKNPDGSEKCW